MGHTDEAAKYARRCCFATLDYYGLNSLFLTTTPDDECSFRVRLYAKPCDWVSAFDANYSILELLFPNFILLLMSSLFIFCFNKHDLPSLKCSDQECIADFQLQKDIRLNHPGACSLEF